MGNLLRPSPFLLLAAVLSATLVLSFAALAQPAFRLPLTVTDSSAVLKSATIYFGFHPLATNCIDPDSLKGFSDHWADKTVVGTPYISDDIEFLGPPFGFTTDMRVSSFTPLQCRLDMMFNIHQSVGPSQVDSFKIAAQGEDPFFPNPLIYTVPSVIGEYCDSAVISGRVPDLDQFGNPIAVTVRANLAKTNGRYVAYPTQTYDLLTSFTLLIYHPKSPPPPPAQVQLVSPVDSATNQSLSPTLVWNAIPLAQSYTYQVASDPAFNSIVTEGTVAGTSKQVTGLQAFAPYYWRIAVTTPYGMSYYQNPAWQFTTGAVSAVDEPSSPLPAAFAVSANYPNPFNPSTTIAYALPIAGHVRVTVYNLFGQELQVLVDGPQAAGYKTVRFDASGLPSGVYLYKVSSGAFTSVQKMALVR